MSLVSELVKFGLKSFVENVGYSRAFRGEKVIETEGKNEEEGTAKMSWWDVLLGAEGWVGGGLGKLPCVNPEIISQFHGSFKPIEESGVCFRSEWFYHFELG